MTKRMLILLCLSVFSAMMHGQSPLRFESYEWDFGALNGNAGAVCHTFGFENKSKSTVRIGKSIPSCECIRAFYPKEEILPGEKGQVMVALTPSKEVGKVNRSVELLDVNGKKEHEKQESEAKVKYEEEQEELERNTLEALRKDREDYISLISDHENEKSRLENINLKELTDEIAANEQMESDIKDTLETYYSTHVLDPEYQDLVPVTTMYGYFKDNRCQELTGHNGAYSLYEKELKAQTITGDLEELLNRTNNLADAQKDILSQVGKVNGKTEALIDSVDRVNAKNMAANPNGKELAKKLEHSRDLETYYGEIRKGMLENLEYIRSVDYISRHWF